jgi:hypothetical protein
MNEAITNGELYLNFLERLEQDHKEEEILNYDQMTEGIDIMRRRMLVPVEVPTKALY